MFTRAITNKKDPATVPPIRAPVDFNTDESSFNKSAIKVNPNATAVPAASTTVECPREKKSPTREESFFSADRRRTVLSIAAIWSASKAWRSPSKYAVAPIPRAIPRELETVPPTINADTPTKCNSAIPIQAIAILRLAVL